MALCFWLLSLSIADYCSPQFFLYKWDRGFMLIEGRWSICCDNSPALLLVQHTMGNRPEAYRFASSPCEVPVTCLPPPPCAKIGLPRMGIPIPSFCLILATPVTPCITKPSNLLASQTEVPKSYSAALVRASRHTKLWSCAVNFLRWTSQMLSVY